MKIVAQFEIPFYQFLNEAGELVDSSINITKKPEDLVQLYKIMCLIRAFDTKAIALQRTGKLGTYPSTRGQEAVFAGIGFSMDKNDILVPYYRDYAAVLMRGVTLTDILLYWGGDERGNCSPNKGEDFPFSVPVGSQGLYAAGAATAIKIRGQKRAVLTTCGDGATSQGDFYEAMNVAGVWKLPMVFVINNNQWAISVPLKAQTAAQTLAQKAIAAGFSGEQVDGNDVIAVVERVTAALKKARDYGTPTLLEVICYRQSDHTTADDASRYEPKETRDIEWKKEPILRLKRYLERIGFWSDEKEQKYQEECTAEVNKITDEYLNIKLQPPESMIDYLYAELPNLYVTQRLQLKKLGEKLDG